MLKTKSFSKIFKLKIICSSAWSFTESFWVNHAPLPYAAYADLSGFSFTVDSASYGFTTTANCPTCKIQNQNFWVFKYLYKCMYNIYIYIYSLWGLIF